MFVTPFRSAPPTTQYSGTNAEFTKADTVIFRADLYEMSSGKKMYNFKRTLKYDSKWLDSEYNLLCLIFSCPTFRFIPNNPYPYPLQQSSFFSKCNGMF